MLKPIDLLVPDSLRNAVESQSRECFAARINNAADQSAEILIFGRVGKSGWDEDAVTPSDVVKFLRENRKKSVTVRINSPGGLAYDGITIHNALIQHDGPVTTSIEGIAGSAAALIAVAGRPAKMMENASFFIHPASGVAVGNAAMMRELAEWLEKTDQQIVTTYAARTGLEESQIWKWVNGDGKKDGTIFSATEALTAGFIDEIVKLERKESATDSVAADQIANVVPSNPPGGSGKGIEGTWSKPTLKDFTSKSWEDLSSAERRRIAAHYGWYDTLDTFSGLKLPHHFPRSGKASLNGVRNALARLPQTQGIPADAKVFVERHLRAHLPNENEDSLRAEWNELLQREVNARLRIIAQYEAAMIAKSEDPLLTSRS